MRYYFVSLYFCLQTKDQYFNKSPARSPMGSPVRGARLNGILLNEIKSIIFNDLLLVKMYFDEFVEC